MTLNKNYYVVELLESGHPQITPSGAVEDVAENELMTWREAKKALRQWYLDQAKALRKVSEKDYFNV